MARAFDGVDQFLEVADDPIVDVGAADFSISLWQRSTAEPADAAAIFGKRLGGPRFEARWRATQNEIRFRINDGGGNDNVDYNGTEIFDGAWHHWLFEREAGVELRIYLDGTQVASNTDTSANLDNGGSLFIGARGNNGGNDTGYWLGEIAEFALFKRILSQGEIDALQIASPLFIRPLPDSHFRLFGRVSPEVDVVSGLTAVLNNGPSFVDHPPAVRQLGRAWHAPHDMAIPLVGQAIAGQSSVAGSLQATAPLIGSIAAQSGVSGQALLQLALRGTVAGQSTITGDLTASVPLVASIDAQSGVTGDLTAIVPLSGALAGQSSVTGTLTNTVFLSATIGGQSGVAGDLTADVPLVGVVISGQSSVAGDLTAAVPLTALVAAQSSVSGDLTAVVPLVGAIAGQSGVTGDLTKLIMIAGQVDGQSSVTGDLAAVVPLAGQVDGQSSLAGLLESTVPLEGVIAGQSSVVGDLGAVVPITGAIAGQSSVAGDLDRTRGLASTIAGQSSVSGDLFAVVPLAGAIAGQSSLDGDATLAISLVGAIAGQSALTARLIRLGETLTTSPGGAVLPRTVGGRVIARGTTGGLLTVVDGG